GRAGYPRHRNQASSVNALHSLASPFLCLALRSTRFTEVARTRGQLWVLILVSRSTDVEPQHHRVVFMDHVVTMHRISSQKVAEGEEQFDFGIVLQSDYVLSTCLDQRTIRRRRPIDK